MSGNRFNVNDVYQEHIHLLMDQYHVNHVRLVGFNQVMKQPRVNYVVLDVRNWQLVKYHVVYVYLVRDTETYSSSVFSQSLSTPFCPISIIK
jgi:hypothetical protein